jgi:hypothetical protein
LKRLPLLYSLLPPILIICAAAFSGAFPTFTISPLWVILLAAIVWAVFVPLGLYQAPDQKNKQDQNRDVSDEEYRYAHEIHESFDKAQRERVNYFLVAESMLLVAFVGALAIPAGNNAALLTLRRCLVVTVSLLGCLYSFGWFYTNRRLGERLSALRDYYIWPKNTPKCEFGQAMKNVWRRTDDAVSTGLWRCTSHLMLEHVLPMSTLALWLALLFYSIRLAIKG